jgi:hypothetical protein
MSRSPTGNPPTPVIMLASCDRHCPAGPGPVRGGRDHATGCGSGVRAGNDIEKQARLLVGDAERKVGRPEDLETVHAQAANVERVLSDRRAGRPPRPGSPVTGPVQPDGVPQVDDVSGRL